MADSEAKRGEKEIKLEDLEGFWEMIHYQVDDLKIKWNDLENLHKNNWILPETNESDKVSSASAAAVKNKPLAADKVNIYKNRKPTVASTKVSSTAASEKPKPAVARSNFRDFLRSKQNGTNKNGDSNGDCVIVSKANSVSETVSSNSEAIVVTGDKEN